MKIGDKICCVYNKSNDDYDDDYNQYTIVNINNYKDIEYYNDLQFYDDSLNNRQELLKNNKIYTIHKILLQHGDLHDSKYAFEEPEPYNGSSFYELSEICDYMFNKKRFITIQEYRKLKLKKLNENR